jgi:hypothetical protein
MPIFGQVWLWSSLAFLLGAVLCWLLVARPARNRVGELEAQLSTQTRRPMAPERPEPVSPVEDSLVPGLNRGEHKRSYGLLDTPPPLPPERDRLAPYDQEPYPPRPLESYSGGLSAPPETSDTELVNQPPAAATQYLDVSAGSLSAPPEVPQMSQPPSDRGWFDDELEGDAANQGPEEQAAVPRNRHHLVEPAPGEPFDARLIDDVDEDTSISSALDASADEPPRSAIEDESRGTVFTQRTQPIPGELIRQIDEAGKEERARAEAGDSADHLVDDLAEDETDRRERTVESEAVAPPGGFTEPGAGLADSGPAFTDSGPESDPAFTETIPRVTDSGPAFTESASGFSEPAPGDTESSPGLTEPAPTFTESASSFTESAPGFAESTPGFTGSASSFAEPASGFAESASSFAEPAPGATESAPSFAESAPGFAESAPSFAKSTPGLDEPAPSFNELESAESASASAFAESERSDRVFTEPESSDRFFTEPASSGRSRTEPESSDRFFTEPAPSGFNEPVPAPAAAFTEPERQEPEQAEPQEQTEIVSAVVPEEKQPGTRTAGNLPKRVPKQNRISAAGAAAGAGTSAAVSVRVEPTPTASALPKRVPSKPRHQVPFGVQPSSTLETAAPAAAAEQQVEAPRSLFEPIIPAEGDGMVTPPPPHRLRQESGGGRGPFGPGSAMPLPGGASPSPEFTIKASVAALRYCTPESPQFGRTVAEVWFRTAADAERVGFRPVG